jgi:MFS transporter, DHA1 family, inner membrane transport protein
VAQGSWLVPIGGLFVAAFVVGTAELIVGGLLPAIATDLAVSIPTAGWLIAGYALGVAIGGPLLGLVTGRLSRRLVLLSMLVAFTAANITCAVAPNFWTLLGARLIVAATQGLVFGAANVVATRIAPSDRQSTAISLIVTGFTAASLAGLPLGTFVGNALGWRISFWAIAALGALAFLLIAILVPRGEGEAATAADLRSELAAIVRPSVLLSFAVMAIFLTADFAVYAYIVPLLTTVTGIVIGEIPWLLFIAGVAGFFGNLLGGRLGDWKPNVTIVGIFALLIAIYALLIPAMHNIGAMIGVCIAWWFVGFAFPAPMQARILKDAADAPNLVSTLLSSAFNVGIAGGAALGSVVLSAGWGYERLPWVSVAFGAAALIGTLILVSLDRPGSAVST